MERPIRSQKEILPPAELRRRLFELFGNFNPLTDEEVDIPERTAKLIRERILFATIPGQGIQLHTIGRGSWYRVNDEKLEKWVRSGEVPLTTEERISHTPSVSPKSLGSCGQMVTISFYPQTIESLAITPEAVYQLGNRVIKSGENLTPMNNLLNDYLNYGEKSFLLIEYWRQLRLENDFYTKVMEFISLSSLRTVLRS